MHALKFVVGASYTCKYIATGRLLPAAAPLLPDTPQQPLRAGAGCTDIQVPEAHVFIRGGEGCKSSDWARLQGGEEEGQQRLRRVTLWAPVGNTDHYNAVSWITTATSFLCCGAVVAGAWKWGSF